MRISRIKENQEGLGLMEVILAFGVSIIVVTALVSLATFVLRSSTESSRMMQATRLANQELERIRVVRDLYIADEDLNWSDFYNAIRDCAFSDPPCGEGSATCSIDLTVAGTQNFIQYGNPPETDGITVCFAFREIRTQPDDSIDTNKADIIAIGTWVLGGERKYVHNYTRLSNWSR